jgi:hypothetical protein
VENFGFFHRLPIFLLTNIENQTRTSASVLVLFYILRVPDRSPTDRHWHRKQGQ